MVLKESEPNICKKKKKEFTYISITFVRECTDKAVCGVVVKNFLHYFTLLDCLL